MSLSYDCLEYVQNILYYRLKDGTSDNIVLDEKYWSEVYTELFRVYKESIDESNNNVSRR